MYDTEECPYCEQQTEIDHDDGYGYEEGKTYQQECSKCGKTFVYTTEISFLNQCFSHSLEKADCLNKGGVHDYKETHTYPKVCARMQCTVCGDEQPLPKEKYEQYKEEEKNSMERFLGGGGV